MTESPDLTKCTDLTKYLQSAYTDNDTLIVDVWGPDMVMHYAKQTFETNFTRDEANKVLNSIVAQFPEGGFLPINPEILAMVDQEIIKIPDTVNNELKPAKD